MTWTVEDAGGYVVVRTAGAFNLDDHRAMVRDIVERPFWRPGRDALFDHRALSFDATGYATMDGAAATHRQFDDAIGGGRAAILMKDGVDYGVGRIFDGLTEGGVQARVRIFSDPLAAQTWIERPIP